MPIEKKECFVGLVGVTPEECACTTGGLTEEQIAELKVSESGLYIDRVGGIDLRAFKSPSICADFYKKTMRALRQAEQDTRNDLIIGMNNRFSMVKPGAQSSIGRRGFTSSVLTAVKDWQGMKIIPVRDGTRIMKINRIDLVLNNGGAVETAIFRRVFGSSMLEPLFEWETLVVGDKYSAVPIGEKIELPFIHNGNRVEYFIGWRKPNSTFFPRDIDFGCKTCGSAPAAYGSEFYSAVGSQFTNPDNVTDELNDGYTHGVLIDYEITCDANRIICTAFDRSNSVDVAVAYAVAFKGAKYLIDTILADSDVTRYTMVSRERLEAKSAQFEQEYRIRVLHASEQLRITETNCFICKETENQPSVHPNLM